MKNLANCTPREFLAQTLKIRKSTKWLKAADISEIMQTKPVITDDMSQTEKREERNKQANKNLSALFDVLMEKHPNETLELLALLCFVEPEHIDDHPMSEYLASLSDMMGSEAVIRFFISLSRLARSGILTL